eukprot:3895764-Rhodomonas_salina.1
MHRTLGGMRRSRRRYRTYAEVGIDDSRRQYRARHSECVGGYEEATSSTAQPEKDPAKKFLAAH